LIVGDAGAWQRYLAGSLGQYDDTESDLVATLLGREPAFRNLVYYRMSHADDGGSRLAAAVLSRIWKPEPTLRLFVESLGPRCFILHGWGSGVQARSIGSDFVLGPHVLVGFSAAHKYPALGDDVKIFVGAYVLGDITLGDHVTVGAGAVVLHDVPDGTTVAGVPARPIGSR